MKENLTKLSKTISHALRHAPWEYELELDEQGWVKAEDLLESLRISNKSWQDLSRENIEKVIAISSKERFELKGEMIRALYGHSISQKLLKEKSKPPESLYHGTSSKFAKIIFKDGLKPMRRQYVHLSSDKETALQVGGRKSRNPELLIVNAVVAYMEGIEFYKGNEHVWLADFIPPEYIQYCESI